MPAVPSRVQPPHLGQVVTNYPELRALVLVGPSFEPELVYVTWNIASNSAFTANFQSVTTDSMFSSFQTARKEIETALTAGTWYVRARATDGAGNHSAWSVANSFEVVRRPSTSSHSPSGGQPVTYSSTVRLSWVYTDADSSITQTKYHVRAYKSSDDTLILDTGEVSSANNFHDWSFSESNLGWVYWQVRVWTVGGVSPWSQPQLFVISNSPSAAIHYPPSGGSVDVPNPTIQWAFLSGTSTSSYQSAQDTYSTYDQIKDLANYSALLESTLQSEQSAWRVVINEGALTVHDTGWQNGSQAAYTLPSVIRQGALYQATLHVRDSGNFEGSTTSSFVANWPAPDAGADVLVDVSAADDPLVGGVHVSWIADLHDPTFVRWVVYRREVTENGLPLGNWTEVGSSFETAGRGEVIDFTFIPGRFYHYAVAQVATRYFDQETESILEPNLVQAVSTNYWLLVPGNPSLNVLIPHVTSDSFTEEYETFESKVIGRGRRVEIGTRFGYSGTLVADLRGLSGLPPSEEKRRIELVKKNREMCWLRIPFGYVWHVHVGDLKITRTPGVGMREFMQVTIPYHEVME